MPCVVGELRQGHHRDLSMARVTYQNPVSQQKANSECLKGNKTEQELSESV